MTKDTPEMFNIEDAYIDMDAIETGRWLPLGAEFPGVEVYARGLSAEPAKRLRNHLRQTAPRKDRRANGQLSDEAEDRILKIVIARECITDWRGLASGGKALPFSTESIENIMNEPRARTIAAAMVNAIVDLEQTKAQAVEDVSGNSQAS